MVSKRAKTTRDSTGDAASLLGMALALMAFLLLISAPTGLYRWYKRAGYQLTDVIVQPITSRNASVRIAATGEEFSVRTTKFETPLRQGPRSVLYNADALLVAGLTLLDERILPSSDPPSAAGGVAPLLLGLALAAASYFALRRGALSRAAAPR
jgi:hypothetical protein